MCFSWTNKEITIVNMHGETIKTVSILFTVRYSQLDAHFQSVLYPKTSMRRITMLRSTKDSMYHGGPIRL